MWTPFGNVHKLCDIGHNVIYSALAIKALRDTGMHPPEMVAGLQDLIQAFDTIRFGMYIGGKGKGVEEMTLAPDDGIPSSSEIGDIVALTFSEFLKFKQIYDLDIHKAQVGHLITHVHALVELLELGYPDLWEEGLTPFKIKVKILRKTQAFKAPKKWRPCKVSRKSPMDAAYWRQDFEASDWDYGHTFKYNYSFHNMIDRLVNPEEKEKCVKHFRYMV